MVAPEGSPGLSRDQLDLSGRGTVFSNAAAIAGQLIAHGRDGSTPALIVESASLPGERRRVVTLAGLGEAAAGLDGPALLIIGEAMARATATDLISLQLADVAVRGAIA